MTTGTKILRGLVGGLLIGGFWYVNRHRPPWEEALRTVVVFSAIMVLLRLRLRRRQVDVHLVPLIATKIVLVVIAAAIETALRDHSVAQPELIVAAGLAVAVCIVNAVGHRYFFTYTGTAPAPSPTAESAQ